MQFSSRARALATRVVPRAQLDLIGVLVPLTVAAIALVAVPIARGAGADGAAVAPTPATGAPAADAAALQPRIDGRLSDRTSTHHDGIAARAIVTRAGALRVRVALYARRAGSSHWFQAAAAHVTAGRKFTLTWRAGRPGRYLTKIAVSKDGRRAADHLGAAYVFRTTYASFYGPGLYGGGLACGGRLTPSTVGVANKSLPCGTRVTFKVGSRIVTAPVIDRGPYVAGRDWDLTEALKRKLHFGSTGAVHSTK